MHKVLPYECLFFVTLILVPFCSRWLQLQTCKMVLFATTAIANVVFYWVMVVSTQFCPMNFLFFVSVHCWVHLVSGGSTLFQIAPTCSRWFQLVTGGSSSFFILVCMQNFTFSLRFSFSTSKQKDYYLTFSMKHKLPNQLPNNLKNKFLWKHLRFLNYKLELSPHSYINFSAKQACFLTENEH